LRLPSFTFNRQLYAIGAYDGKMLPFAFVCLGQSSMLGWPDELGWSDQLATVDASTAHLGSIEGLIALVDLQSRD
jgi:hypothetical protein